MSWNLIPSIGPFKASQAVEASLLSHDEAGFDPPRRAMLKSVTALGLATATLALTGESEAASRQAEVGGVASLATIADLAELGGAVNLADVRGLLSETDGGGGLFIWQFAAIGRTQTDGAIRIASKVRGDDGFWLRVGYDGATLRPEWFGTLDDVSDHAPIIQRAIDFAMGEKGGLIDLGRRTYRCLSTIEMDPTLCILAGSAAVLDFSDRADVEADPVAKPLSLQDLAKVATGAWSADPEVLWQTENGGPALVAQHRLKRGERYRLDLQVAELAGDPNNPYLKITLANAATAKEEVQHVITAAGRHVYEFEWTSPEEAMLSLSSNCAVRIEAFLLEARGKRECLRIRCRVDSPQYGHTWMQGVRLRGPGKTGRRTTLDGIRFETETPTLASRLSLRDIMVEGFATAVVMSDRCYLVQFSQVTLIGEVAVHFLSGTDDAGENISFFGCILGGGRIGVLNGGAEINMFGTSINFTDQFYVGGGSFFASGCHFETERTQSPTQYLFDACAGCVTLSGGTILVSGRDFDKGNKAKHVVMTRSKLACFSMDGTFCFNLRSSTNVFAGGPGVVRLTNINGDSAKFIAPIPTRDAASNIFGPASQLDRDPIGLFVRLLDNDARDPGGLGAISRSTGELEPAIGMLESTKAGEAGTPLFLWLLAPATAGMRTSWSLSLKVAGGEESVSSEFRRQVVLDLLYVQIIPDVSGPVGGSVLAKRSRPIELDSRDDWLDLTGSTLDTREDEWANGAAPAFATHIALRLDLAALARGERILLHSPYAAAV